MDDIIEPTMDYDFTKLYFGPPTTLAGGAYFSRIMYNSNKALYIQCPKSLTKQGFIKSGKKIYTDLMFDNNDTVFINWIENLEARCHELVYSKRETWFETKLEKDDIENAFTSPFKIFKSGKNYLLRVNVKQNIKIYDEKDQVIGIDTVTNDNTIISILEVQGLKFTSRNFQIEIELKQAMIVSPDPFLDECFIRKPLKKNLIKDDITDIDLDNLINQSVKDLAKTDIKNAKVEQVKEDKEDKSMGSIDLNVSFNEPEHQEEINNTKSLGLDLGLEEANIVLDDEEFTEPLEEVMEEVIEDPSILKEVDLSSTLDDKLETITLKKPNQVYYEIYQKAREKAKESKKNAILAYLEMKNIKKTYMLDDIDESDSEFDEFASMDGSSEISDSESLEDDF